ncbi:methyl-accepting chemotaxis protein [Meridianimarinicoccus roseus]|nr:methyl-accepting chemotaxis protein [Meridianimarinicoccus roseus]
MPTKETVTEVRSLFQKPNVGETLRYLSNPVMLSDSNHVIRVVNNAAVKMLSRIESEIRRDLPNFRADDLVGKSIDVFHKNPNHQRALLDGMKEQHSAKFTLGGVQLAFMATPIFKEDGELDGVIVEWRDERSAQRELLREEIEKMAIAHNEGMIETYIDLDRFDVETAETARLVNEMVKNHIATKKRIIAVTEEFGKGNFDVELEQFSGQRAFINVAVEKVRERFKAVVGEISRLSDSIVDGRLDVSVNRDGFQGEYLDIVNSFDRAFSSLNQSFNTIAAQVDQVGQTVSQMNDASQSLAENSQITSASVDEVSASAEETDAQVKANAEAARNADTLVNAASKVAEEGSRKVDSMVGAMQDINASSSDIAKIIKVIDEIAFQTNLLALNAAVEAARAGQHGRGFAVVAQEVRNLAGRSAKAARETSDLIESATDRVGAGVRIANETSEAFEKIVSDIEQVKTLVQEINSASEEQSRGVAQINQAIGEVAKTALSTSQQADELSATAQQMTAATTHMTKEIQRFRLREVKPQTEFGATALDQLSPELLQQIQMMMAAGAMPAAAPAKPNGALNGKVNGNGKVKSGDHDERGFEMF